MLFDLQSRGRRRTVKVVYVTLAILMGGGLVLFGIGGEVSGGLVDAITEDSGGDPSDRFAQREEQALARTRANPRDQQAWVDLARARVQVAGQGDNVDPATGNYSASGQAKLRQATQAWERYLALDPARPDDRTANLIVQAYDALGQPAGAAQAQEIIAEARPSAGAYSRLAIFAYQARNRRLGDLARREALRRTEPDLREQLRGQLEQARNGGLPAEAGGSG